MPFVNRSPEVKPQCCIPIIFSVIKKKKKGGWDTTLNIFLVWNFFNNRCCRVMHAATQHFPYLVSLFAKRATVHTAE